MKRIAIVGGGISGLSAAFTLEKERRSGAHIEYVLFEASSRLGGVLLTENVDGCEIEAGPDSFLTEKTWASDLCREIGLGDQLVGSNDRERKTYVLVNGKLLALPDGLMFMVPTRVLPAVFSPLFSTRTKLRMAREWFHARGKNEADETVASFVERHYGAEMVERLADPLLSGIYGGDAGQLSVRAVLPRFAEMEAEHGSLGRAMLAARSKAPRPEKVVRPLFTSLKGGMQQIADALTARIPSSALRLNSLVQLLEPQRGGWLVSAGYASDQFDAVVVATPANRAADLLRLASVDLASEFHGVQYTSSIVVNVVYEGAARSLLPPGFGFLVPRTEGKRLMATTFVHNKFPHRVPANRALLRCFIGGARNEEVLEFSDDKIMDIVQEELRQILGLATDPLFARIHRWKHAMAQYGVGHLERLGRIEKTLLQLPGLALAGNGYRGIGVPDCIRSGNEAAGRVLAALRAPAGQLPTTA